MEQKTRLGLQKKSMVILVKNSKTGYLVVTGDRPIIGYLMGDPTGLSGSFLLWLVPNLVVARNVKMSFAAILYVGLEV